jgi:uncharacterized protein YodC (DUF2158 family)
VEGNEVMAENFTIGDVVQLKSGGPKMTVTSFGHGDKSVEAGWFAGSKHESSFFHPESLISAPVETQKG